MIEWSWDLLLRKRDRRSRSSPSSGRFAASTAAAVLGDGAADDLLDQLVSHSLLMVVEAPDGSGVRFRMLEIVREFGHARLVGENAAWEAVIAAHVFSPAD